jgi:hypothetical protein
VPAPPSANPSPSAQPSPTGEPTPLAIAKRVELDDAPDDVLEDGDPVPSSRPGTDIVRLVVEARDDVLDLNIYTAEAPPRNDDPLVHEHHYWWHLDVDGDNELDWQVSVGNTTHEEDANVPGWVAQATFMEEAQTRFGREFPGTVLIEGTRINVQMPLDTIRATGEIAVIGYSADAMSIGGRRNEHYDSAPDNHGPDPSSWVTVKR